MRLLNRRYEEIKKSVTNLFAWYGISSIPIDVFRICKMLGIRLIKYSEMKSEKRFKAASKDGFYVLIKLSENVVQRVIYYDDTMPLERIRFTLMHELGHIILDHKEYSDVAETEANFFAKYALAPPPIVHLIKPSDYLDIAWHFNLSAECAWNAMEYYKKWYAYHRNDKPAYEAVLINLFEKSVS